MATITLTIPDGSLPRVRDALCSAAGLPSTNANAKAAVITWIRATVAAVEYADTAAAQPPIPEPDTAGIVT